MRKGSARKGGIPSQGPVGTSLTTPSSSRQTAGGKLKKRQPKQQQQQQGEEEETGEYTFQQQATLSPHDIDILLKEYLGQQGKSKRDFQAVYRDVTQAFLIPSDTDPRTTDPSNDTTSTTTSTTTSSTTSSAIGSHNSSISTRYTPFQLIETLRLLLEHRSTLLTACTRLNIIYTLFHLLPAQQRETYPPFTTILLAQQQQQQQQASDSGIGGLAAIVRSDNTITPAGVSTLSQAKKWEQHVQGEKKREASLLTQLLQGLPLPATHAKGYTQLPTDSVTLSVTAPTSKGLRLQHPDPPGHPLRQTALPSRILWDPQLVYQQEQEDDNNTTTTTTTMLSSAAESIGTPSVATLGGWEPSYLRPTPGLSPVHPAEVTLLGVGFEPDMLWDNGMCAQTPQVSQALLTIVTKARTEALSPDELQQVKEAYKNDPASITPSGLTPYTLPDMIETNIDLAVEGLVHLASMRAIPEYLQALLFTKMSLRSMECVKKLTSAIALPEEFLHFYIAKCFKSCEDTVDTQQQRRTVRLVCVFLQSLIQARAIRHTAEIFVPVQTFCIQFSSVREAAILFKLVKQQSENA